jgi:hypothetical protein
MTQEMISTIEGLALETLSMKLNDGEITIEDYMDKCAELEFWAIKECQKLWEKNNE